MNVHSNDKKEQIFKATLQLIGENGLHNTPMSMITKRSKVSAGTIYHYFSSKEELINSLYVEIKKEMGGIVYDGLDELKEYKDRFIFVCRNMFDFMSRNPLVLSFIEQCDNSPMITKASKNEGDKYHSPIIKLIEEGIDKGIIRKADLRLVLYLVYSSITSTIKLQISGEVKITGEMKKYAEEFAWKGIT